MKELPKPWQVMPAKIIKMALEHAEKGTDFDHQISFLLLDIGVENTLKTYLVNKNQNVDHLNFKDLIQKVKEESEKDKKEVPLDEVNYFHTVRNKLYHQGDGVKPTGGNLERYLELAQKILKILIGVDDVTDIEPPSESKYVVQGKKGKSTIDDISYELLKRLEYFRESCAILTEQKRPKYATRKFAIKLHSIWKDLGGVPSQDIFDDARSLEILHLFNKLSGMHTEDQGLVDFLIKDPNHLYVMIALQDFSENFDDDWDKYKNISATVDSLPDTWKYAIDNSRLDSAQIYKKYKVILSWVKSHQDKIGKRLNELIPDIEFYRPGPTLRLDFSALQSMP